MTILRFRAMRPADPAHIVPYPGRVLPLARDGEPVDMFDGYWNMALADGSIVAANPAPPPAPERAAPASTVPPATPASTVPPATPASIDLPPTPKS